jgi:arabinose-5-phosphate isomerase
MQKTTSQETIQTAKTVLNDEANAILDLRDRIDCKFVLACEEIVNCSGKVIVTGMGKSGIIARKFAATLSSTGTPAFFVHPAEATHGDLGVISCNDILFVISNSGETDELLTIIPIVKRMGVAVFSMTGKSGSTIATHSKIHLDVGVKKEACLLGLAPTSSTTATLAMGDALAVSVLQLRGFTPEDFAKSHPSGALGRKLLIRVCDVMKTGNEIPKVGLSDTLSHSIIEITRKRVGMTAVVDEDGRAVGIFTDGDLRRILKDKIDFEKLLISDVMSKNPIILGDEQLATEALQLMEIKNVTSLLITSKNQKLVGVVHISDLINSKVI